MDAPESLDLLHALTLAARKVRHDLDRKLRPIGLTDAKYQVLQALVAARGVPVTKAHIARKLGVSTQAVTKELGRLGTYVRVEKALSGPRMDQVQIRAEGRDLERAARKIRKEYQDALLYATGLGSSLRNDLDLLTTAAYAGDL
jgi:hypothetical protein